MGPKPYDRKLSVLPEGASLRCRFTFVIVGPNAHAVTNKVSEAELHAEVTEIMERQTKANSKSPKAEFGVSITEFDQAPNGGAELTLTADEKGTYCLLDADLMDVARIRFVVVESFSDAVPKLNDQNGIRNTCFLFLADGRLDVEEDILTILNQAFTEMRFSYNQVSKKSNALWKAPQLRGVVLSHIDEPFFAGKRPSGVTKTQSMESVNAQTVDQRILAFNEKLEEVTKGGPVKSSVRFVNFDDSNALYDLFESISREMLKPTRWGATSTKYFKESTKKDETGKPCCVIH